ncbi:MAG: DUF917 domain-containing protein [Granulosicoccus sp.]
MTAGLTTETALKEITEADMENIALGGAFLGTGGGGDPYIGKLMAIDAIKTHGPVSVIDVDSLDDDALVVPVAMMGAPTVMLEKLPRGNEALKALKTLQEHLGKKADAVFCIEAGGLNSTIPLAVAAATGLPVVDGDAMGRAFPELQMVSMTLHGIRACPMIMADEKGNAILLDAVDNSSTEQFARPLTVEMGGSSLIALYPMTGAQAKLATLRGSLSLIHSIGKIIRAEQAANRPPAALLAETLDGFHLFEGRVVDIERKTEGGFARGECRLVGMGSFTGRTLTLQFQNEFLMARTDDEKPVAMTPDLISLLDLDTGEPITTEAIRFGFRVLVFGLACDSQWRMPQGIALVGPRYFGYECDYQAIEELND